MNSISANLNIMIKASEKASKALIRDFGEVEKLQVSAKGPLDFVSSADKKAEKIIINELNKSRKKYSIISEEYGSKINEDKDRLLELEVKKYGRTPTKKEVKKKEYTNVYSRNRRKLISRQGSTS